MSKVPGGWVRTTLEDFIEIKHGFAFKSEFFSDTGDYVLMTPGSFYEEGGFRDQKGKTKYYSGTIPDGYILNKGDVLLAMTEQGAGLLGSAAIVPENNKYLHNQRLGLLKVKDISRASAEFFFWLYNFPLIRKQINEQASGTKVKHTSPDRLRGVTALVPPLSEQQKIAKILSTWDKAISTTEQLISNSQQQKKALMDKLLTGTKRLSKAIDPFKEYRFSELLEIDSKTLSNKFNKDFEFDYISLSDVNNGYISDKLKKYTVEEAPSRAKRVVHKGDVLLSTVRPNLQGFAKIEEKHDGFIASTGFSVLTSNKNVCSDYIYHYVFSKHITDQINSLVAGTNYPAINSSDVANLVIYCPDYKEQVEISSVLNISCKMIQLLQKKLAGLKQEKQALMQQLLTGKRRVVV
ncbi:type I restriction-modification system, specificity subunit S [Buttiauxella brennerae ATCC 51605]|uniref:Type I restriction-modification system, specificity subunit S n=1 Tax=Buttiauxella brennerae ATCC 51605 TaxID=1354251 RepID=A0A1B7IHH8_9ENTR|nr:restriction endonuclease subunit S [Buttiauxella brennerae]OAT28882.1 type I restriction-modification system, specificity subunit S [Buttiauxella brennerae ATCC 51605]